MNTPRIGLLLIPHSSGDADARCKDNLDLFDLFPKQMSKSYLTSEIKKIISDLDPDRLLNILYLYIELATYFMTTVSLLDI